MDSIEAILDQGNPDLSDVYTPEDLAVLRIVLRSPASSTIFGVLDKCEDLAND